MKLNIQKRLAAQILKCSKDKVKFEEDRLEDIKEAITKADIRALIIDKAISRKKKKGISRARARKRGIQRRKGRQKGYGSRKGKKTARLPKKKNWMNRVRLQRSFLKELKEKKLIDNKNFRDLYRKSKGGFFRSKRHIKIYLEEHDLIKKKKEKVVKKKEVKEEKKKEETKKEDKAEKEKKEKKIKEKTKKGSKKVKTIKKNVKKK